MMTITDMADGDLSDEDGEDELDNHDELDDDDEEDAVDEEELLAKHRLIVNFINYYKSKNWNKESKYLCI